MAHSSQVPSDSGVRLDPDTLIADRYRVRSRIAAGGMGEVWAADDERLGREVAVKVIRSDRAAGPRFMERFRAEARAAAGISHPGIVAVHDYGDGPEGPFLVMELVHGESLDAILAREGRLAPDRVLDLLAQAGAALQAAHDAGLVHRDIKPGNLMVRQDGRVQVTDFGTARSVGTETLSEPGALVGTPQYLAPEQAAGGEPTAAGDVFGLGVIAYEALAGRRPFDAHTTPGVIAALLYADAPPLPDDVPEAVAELVRSCLVRDPADRIPTAQAVAARARELRTPETPASGEQTPAAGWPHQQGQARSGPPRRPEPPAARPSDAGTPPWVRAVAIVVGVIVLLWVLGALITGCAFMSVSGGGGSSVQEGPQPTFEEDGPFGTP